MRIRTAEWSPHSREEIERWVRFGPPRQDPENKNPLVRRLRQSFYLDRDNKALNSFGRLLGQYKNDGLVLFLGAGVSCDSGIPNWHGLIEKLLKRVFASEKDRAEVKRVWPNLMAQFDLLAYQLHDPNDFYDPTNFYKELYCALYGSREFANAKSIAALIPTKPEDQRGWIRWNELQTELEKNKTLKAVADLLIIDSERSFRRNPQIHSVLTTNADNLLELYCQAKSSGEHLLTMVDRASVGDHPWATPVYHLHGTLDARGENFMRARKPCSKVPSADLQEINRKLLPGIVFRESEYYETLSSPTSFVNHTPQSYFQRLNVLFIGTSLDDLNIRRWLYSSFRERVKKRTKYLQEYYCRKYKDAEFEAELESVRHFWLRTKKESDHDVPMELVDCAMRKLGVQVVWCDDFSDVCRHLERLKEDGHDPNFGLPKPED